MPVPDDHALQQFFGFHFYQSFDSEYGRIGASLWDLLGQVSEDKLTRLVAGIHDLLQRNPSEAEVKAWYRYTDLGLYPPGNGDGPTHRQFLEWVLQEAEEELARHHAPPGEGPTPYRPMLDSWTHSKVTGLRPYAAGDRVTALLTHPSATVEVLVASDLDERPPETLQDDQWVLCLDGMLTFDLDFDAGYIVLGRDEFLSLPAGTRIHLLAARPDSRWLRLRLPPDPSRPTPLPHPGAIL